MLSGGRRHCVKCKLDWPPAGWQTCGKCEGPLQFLKTGTPMAKDLANRIAAHAEFERWLAAETTEQRDKRRARWRREQRKREQTFRSVVASLE